MSKYISNDNFEAQTATDRSQEERLVTTPLRPNSKESDQEREDIAAAPSVLTNSELTHKVTRITNEQIQESLSRHSFFHGFLLHEYQPMLLKSYGEYLMRLSVQSTKKHANRRKASREASNNQKMNHNNRISVIFGVYIKDNENVKPTEVTARSVYLDFLDGNKTKNEIIDIPLTIEQNPDKKWVTFYIEKRKKFPSIEELILYYKNHLGYHKDKKFNLLKGVPLFAWELDRNHLEIGSKLLGEGAFGEVRNGVLRNSQDFPDGVPVAIKSLKSEDSKDCIKEMMHEARLQLCMRNKNVLRTIGVCILKTPLFIVTEYCEHGALREYLKKNQCDIEEKLRFGLGSAKGVEYIHGKMLIHRDLATRNVLLTESNVPKIADFGMARYGSSYKLTGNAKIPIRYLAPETLTTFRFSQKSDVYAFGLLIWEIFENGCEPYVKPQPHQELIVSKGSQIKAPQLKELMKKDLWIKFNPETPLILQQFVVDRIFVLDEKKRASMSEMCALLRGVLKSLPPKHN